MKISEALFDLQAMLDTHGDLEMVGLVLVDDTFVIDKDRTLEVVEIDIGEDDIGQLVCAFMEQIDDEPQGLPN